MKNTFFILSFLLFILPSPTVKAQIKSPNGKIQVEVKTNPKTIAQLDITFNKKHVLSIDNLFLTANNTPVIAPPYDFLTINPITSYKENYTMPWGENKQLHSRYHETSYTFRNSRNVCLTLVLRVFDNAVAFCIVYDMHPDLVDFLVLTGEKTQFHFPPHTQTWSIPANFESYEFLYRHQDIDSVESANTPFTFCTPSNIWGSIHEASICNMPEMALRKNPSPNTLEAWLCPDNTGSGSVAKKGTFFQTPWRTVYLGEKAVDLINNHTLLDLNLPNALGDSLPFRPMKYVGIWWGMHLGINSWIPDHRHGATTQNAITLIDFAHQNNIDAVLFEGWNLGWEQWGGNQQFSFTRSAPDIDIDSVIRYAHNQDVEVIIHHETGGNIPNYEAQMDSAFRWCRERDIHVIKTGYAGAFPDRNLHHSQYGVIHYNHVMSQAARYGIALDVHEPIKPSGLARNYPNLMSGEGGRGMEWNAWSDGNPPSHQTILPFTRLLAGPMDYTPGIFDIEYKCLQDNPDCQQWNQQDSRNCRVHTTLAHQVALWVVLYSPLQMAADLPENYLVSLPDGSRTTHPMFDFFRRFNPDCDQSVALDGTPGNYVVISRRAKETFYLGAITNEQSRDLSVPLTFLPRGQRFRATLYADSPDADYRSNPTAFQISDTIVSRHHKLNLHLAPGGGCAIILEPLKETSEK